MLLSIIQKSKSIMGLGESSLSPTSSAPPAPAPNDLQSRPEGKSSSPMELQSAVEPNHTDFQELIYGTSYRRQGMVLRARNKIRVGGDYIRSIKDPEKPATLEDLHVVYEEGVKVKGVTAGNVKIVEIEFNPTVPHCSLATLIGLCIRVQLERTVAHSNPFKLDIYIKKGAHNTEDEINKQINDKERIAAAMENPNLRKIVEECIQEED